MIDPELRTYLEGMDSRMQTMESKLLTAFHDRTRSFEIILRDGAAQIRLFGLRINGFDERLSLAEERISRLEHRLPPE